MFAPIEGGVFSAATGVLLHGVLPARFEVPDVVIFAGKLLATAAPVACRRCQRREGGLRMCLCSVVPVEVPPCGEGPIAPSLAREAVLLVLMTADSGEH